MRQWKQSCVTARKRWCFVITTIVIIPSFQADKKHQCSCFTNAIMKILILKLQVMYHFMCENGLSKELLPREKSSGDKQKLKGYFLGRQNGFQSGGAMKHWQSTLKHWQSLTVGYHGWPTGKIFEF